MKKFSAFMLSVLCAGSSMADVTLPYGITPLNGEVRLLYQPGFEATCKAINGADPNDALLTSVTSLKLDAIGRFKYSLTMDDSTVTFDVNANGAGINSNTMQFANKGAKSNDLLTNIFKSSPPGYGVIGKPLRNGSKVESPDIINEICKVIPGGKSSFFSSLDRKVVGKVFIHGRPSLVIATKFNVTCTIDKMGEFTVTGGGWESFDLQSGLNSDTESHMSFKVRNEPEVNINMASSCVISDTAQRTAAPSGNTLEARLTELKGLMEKGLITQEQYEQKRADILKAL